MFPGQGAQVIGMGAEAAKTVPAAAALYAKAAEILGFRPKVDFATGIANYVAWFKQRYANPAVLLEADHRNWTLPA
jgi:malonyl CoA-acyl carrier protein transacylase